MRTSILHKLYNKEYWTDIFLFFERRSYRQDKKLEAYRDILNKDQYKDIANAVLKGKYIFSDPLRIVVNKLQTGKKKVVYLFNFRDDFLLKVINRILTENYARLIVPACHSFQKGKGAKTAFRSITADPYLDEKHCLKTDIHNFFNSILVEDFLFTLPVEIKSDKILYPIIHQLLTNKNSILPGGTIIQEQKGLMAGCPLSPFLSNIYLRELDDYYTRQKVTYTRYSDDIVLFDYENRLRDHKNHIESYLESKSLKLNPLKTSISGPNEMASFLGFSYFKKIIDLSPVSMKKMKGKVERMSKSYHRRLKKGKMTEVQILQHFISRLNRKLFGMDARENDLCWAQWFFPVINTDNSLKMLDNYIQQRLRYSLTGKYNKLNYRKVPYSLLQHAGYIPLNRAFHLYKKDFDNYVKLTHPADIQAEAG